MAAAKKLAQIYETLRIRSRKVDLRSEGAGKTRFISLGPESMCDTALYDPGRPDYFRFFLPGAAGFAAARRGARARPPSSALAASNYRP